MSTAPVMKKPPPPPASKNGTPSPIASNPVTITRGVRNAAQKIGIYGPGGVGKTSLVANMERIGKKPLFIDLDEGSNHLDVARINVATWEELRGAVQNESLWTDYDTVVIDTATKAEELAGVFVVANVTDKKGRHVKRLAEYGYGDDKAHIYDAFLCLFADLDARYRQGKNIVLIMHECTANVPNPAGEDFIRWEPRLQSPKSGQNSLRHKVKEWVDHLLFIGYDVHASEDGKATGHGTRTIYPQELPTHWAKSRTLAKNIFYERDSVEVWNQVFSIKENV